MHAGRSGDFGSRAPGHAPFARALAAVVPEAAAEGPDLGPGRRSAAIRAGGLNPSTTAPDNRPNNQNDRSARPTRSHRPRRGNPRVAASVAAMRGGIPAPSPSCTTAHERGQPRDRSLSPPSRSCPGRRCRAHACTLPAIPNDATRKRRERGGIARDACFVCARVPWAVTANR